MGTIASSSPASFCLCCCTHSQREACWTLYKDLCCLEEHTTWTPMTNVCLPQMLWDFLVFFKASKTLCNIWWCTPHLYSKGQTHWREWLNILDIASIAAFFFNCSACWLSFCLPVSVLRYSWIGTCILWVRSTCVFFQMFFGPLCWFCLSPPSLPSVCRLPFQFDP